MVAKIRKGRMKSRDKGRKFMAADRNEPKVPSIENTQTHRDELLDALQFYYNAETSGIAKRDWVVEFMECNDYSKDSVKKMKHINDKLLTHPDTSLIRLINRGYDAPEKYLRRVELFITKVLSVENDVEVKEVKKLNPLAEYRKNQTFKDENLAGSIKCIFEGNIDDTLCDKDFPLRDFSELVVGEGVNKNVVMSVKTWIEYRLAQFTNYTKEDLSLAAYRLKKLTKWMEDLVDSCDKYLAATKVAKARTTVRKARKKDPIKITKYMKFKREGSNAEPKDIVSARAVVTYNDKYNILTFYRSQDVDGLTVKGSKVVNYSDTKTVSKRFKSNAPIDTFLEAINESKNLGDISDMIEKHPKFFGKSDIKINGSINANTLLLKVL